MLSKRFLTIIVNFHSKEVIKLPQQVSFPLLPKYGSLFMKLFSYKSNICFCKRNEIKKRKEKLSASEKEKNANMRCQPLSFSLLCFSGEEPLSIPWAYFKIFLYCVVLYANSYFTQVCSYCWQLYTILF